MLIQELSNYGYLSSSAVVKEAGHLTSSEPELILKV